MNRKMYWMFLLILLSTGLRAQVTDTQIDMILGRPLTANQSRNDSALDPKLQAWVLERKLDSLDQEKIPKIVTMGVLLSTNMSNFIISTHEGSKIKSSSSYLRIGVEMGGFLDFLVTRHFAIQVRLVLTAEQNHFDIGDSSNRLWSFGTDIPALFLYRLGNLEKGYWNIGGGIFAHFTFASDREGIFTNTETVDLATAHSEKPFYVALHDNHAGLMAHFDYEFPFGLQIGANYLISLSDIFGFYKNTEGTRYNDAAFYPQRIAVGVAYRWK